MGWVGGKGEGMEAGGENRLGNFANLVRKVLLLCLVFFSTFWQMVDPDLPFCCLLFCCSIFFFFFHCHGGFLYLLYE